MKRYIPALIIIAAFLLVLWLLAGCRAAPRPSPIAATGEAIARAGVRNESIGYHVRKVTPKVMGEERAHLQSAEVDVDAQAADLAEGKAQVERTASDYAATTGELTKIKAGFWYRLGVWVWWAKWMLIGAFVLATILRGASLAMPGNPLGVVFSFISTGILGFLSSGVSLIQALFDNLFFRKVKPAEDAKAFYAQGGGIATVQTAGGTTSVIGQAADAPPPAGPPVEQVAVPLPP